MEQDKNQDRIQGGFANSEVYLAYASLVVIVIAFFFILYV